MKMRIPTNKEYDRLLELTGGDDGNEPVSIPLKKSEWENILSGLELAIDDRQKMSKTAFDAEDTSDCAESAEELARLHDVISDCIAE